MKKFILTVITILWMAVIFSFSARPAEESGEMSMSVGRVAGKIFVAGFTDWTEERKVEFVKVMNYPLRKCAHATEYAILGGMLMLTIESYKGSINYRILLSFVIGVSYAFGDEFHQLFVAGRNGNGVDVLIDSLGLAAGVLTIYVIQLLYNRKLSERIIP